MFWRYLLACGVPFPAKIRMVAYLCTYISMAFAFYGIVGYLAVSISSHDVNSFGQAVFHPDQLGVSRLTLPLKLVTRADTAVDVFAMRGLENCGKIGRVLVVHEHTQM